MARVPEVPTDMVQRISKVCELLEIIIKGGKYFCTFLYKYNIVWCSRDQDTCVPFVKNVSKKIAFIEKLLVLIILQILDISKQVFVI